MLTLNLNLLWTVVNVLVLFLLLRKFLYRPVMNIIAERQKQVDDALAAAETSKSEAAAALNAAQDKLPKKRAPCRNVQPVLTGCAQLVGLGHYRDLFEQHRYIAESQKHERSQKLREMQSAQRKADFLNGGRRDQQK